MIDNSLVCAFCGTDAEDIYIKGTANCDAYKHISIAPNAVGLPIVHSESDPEIDDDRISFSADGFCCGNCERMEDELSEIAIPAASLHKPKVGEKVTIRDAFGVYHRKISEVEERNGDHRVRLEDEGTRWFEMSDLEAIEG